MGKETWSVGNNGGCVISNEKPERSSYDEQTWEIEKEMTGGYIIAESIPSIENAKLIAAAPDMLEAIKYYFDVLDEVRGKDWDKNPDHVLSKMINAIKKATE